jgi:hypothetical protein
MTILKLGGAKRSRAKVSPSCLTIKCGIILSLTRMICVTLCNKLQRLQEVNKNIFESNFIPFSKTVYKGHRVQMTKPRIFDNSSSHC